MTTIGDDGTPRCDWAEGHELLRRYHDEEYGHPRSEDRELLERLALEIMQAGLSWLTVLKKRPALVRAFEGFDPERVAAYGEPEVARLLGDACIIRNRLKIRAIIHNAGRFLEIRQEHGSVKTWLDAQGDLPRADWVRLFKRTFRFTGGEITGEFLMSLGYLPIHHDPGCFKAG